MTIRFFVLSAHYRGTVDFSNEALVAAEKGLEKLLNAISDLERLSSASSCHDDKQQCDPETEKVVKTLRQRCYDAMNDEAAMSTTRVRLLRCSFWVHCCSLPAT